MKKLCIAVLFAFSMIGFAVREVVNRAVGAVHEAKDEVMEIDREVQSVESTFIEVVGRLLPEDADFHGVISWYQTLDVGIVERQREFMLLSGDALAQLTDRSASPSALQELQDQLHRRSVLVRRFEKRAEEYQRICGETWRGRIARFAGGCQTSF